MRKRLRSAIGALLIAGTAACVATVAARRPEATEQVPHGRLETINGCRVLSLDGTPEQMGTACGKLLRKDIARVVDDMITTGIGVDPDAYRNILAGSKVMEQFQPGEYLDELKALAKAAGVSYDDLLLLQYFGDVRRCIAGPGSSGLCTSFAILPPWSKDGACIVGRNFDYFDNGVGEYASLLVYYRPQGRIPFVTITWAGIINGWTLLNERGVVVSNDTAFGGSNAIQGISTCFLLRYVAERATSVKEGVDLILNARRSCGTNVLVASGNPPDAAVVEFDHDETAVLRPADGFVGTGNGYAKLHQDQQLPHSGRVENAYNIVQANKGRITVDSRVAGAEGVPIDGMNLHSAMIDATNLRLRVAMGKIPAYRLPFRALKLTPQGLVDDSPVSGRWIDVK